MEIIRKINIVSILIGLCLFGLPWVDIQCSGKSIATQTGFQAMVGSGTPVTDSSSRSDVSLNQGAKDSDENLGLALLVFVAFIFCLLALGYGLFGLLRNSRKTSDGSSILAALALVLLVTQAAIGFPAEAAINESSQKKEASSSDDGFGESLAAAMIESFDVQLTAGFYFELVCLGIPTLLLLNSFVDRYKPSEQVVPPKSDRAGG